jgi:hypothetical protein
MQPAAQQRSINVQPPYFHQSGSTRIWLRQVVAVLPQPVKALQKAMAYQGMQRLAWRLNCAPVRDIPSLQVAVQTERLKQPTRWEDWRLRITDVLLDEGQFGSAPRLLRDDGVAALHLHPGLRVQLHQDEGEGYWLNLDSGAPVWFVMWRSSSDEGNASADPPLALPQLVTLSYNEAGRLLDAQERVDNVPLPADVRAWLQAFVDQHYRPEPKQRKRPASFRAPGER